MRQVPRNDKDTTPFIIIDDEKTRRINAIIFPHKTRFDSGIALTSKSSSGTKINPTTAITRIDDRTGVAAISMSQLIGTGVTSCYCILPDSPIEGTYLIITEKDGVGGIIPIVVITSTALQMLTSTVPESAKISGNSYVTMTGAFNTLTLVYTNGTWRKVSGSTTSASPLIIPLLNLSVTVQVDAAQDILIGGTYFDNATLTSGGATSYVLKAIMSKTGHSGCPSGFIQVGLRDADGIITSAGSIISQTILQTTSSSIVQVSTDVTSILSSASGPGILEALVVRDGACAGRVDGRIDSMILQVNF